LLIPETGGLPLPQARAKSLALVEAGVVIASHIAN
jgi:hypothetical protein